MITLEKTVDAAQAAETEARQDIAEIRTKTLATAQLSPQAEELLRAHITLIPATHVGEEDLLRIDVKGWRADLENRLSLRKDDLAFKQGLKVGWTSHKNLTLAIPR